jgi:hypothetical protein
VKALSLRAVLIQLFVATGFVTRYNARSLAETFFLRMCRPSADPAGFRADPHQARSLRRSAADP